MFKTIFYSVREFIALTFWKLEVYASQYYHLLLRGCNVLFMGWLSYLKKLWSGYLDRQHYRKEVQRRLLRQRSYKRERQPQSGHWTDRLLKLRGISCVVLLPFPFAANAYRFIFPLLLLLGLLVYLPFVGHAAIRHELVEVSDSIQPLKVGDVVPDLPLENIINYKSKSAKLSDFKGKLVILDFWATWCAPCIYTIPKADSLQSAFNDRVQFIGIAYQDEQTVQRFFKELGGRIGHDINVPCVVSDRLWSAYFPHQTMPHYVWIKDEKVIAITDFQEVNAKHIQNVLSGKQVKMVEKNEVKIPFDRKAPLLMNGNGGDGHQLIYHSILTSYIPGLGVGIHYYRYPKPEEHMQRITARNNDLYLLYQLAYGEGVKQYKKKDILLEVQHPEEVSSELTGTAFANWLAAGHGYCYELQVPPALSKQAFKIMQQDLDRFFPQYQASVEERLMDCWVLKLKGDAKAILADTTSKRKLNVNAFGAELVNVPLFALVERLDGYYLQLESEVIDETGIQNPVSLNFKADMANVASINEGLAPYHLQLEKAKRKIEVLVVRDQKGGKVQ